MSTIIRGKAGKDNLRALLAQHDDCVELIAVVADAVEPFAVEDVEKSFSIHITKDEFVSVLSSRLSLINTKLENLGLKIGDEVQEGTN